MWTPVYVGVGSNLNNPLNQVKTAVAHLANSAEVYGLVASTAVESAPVGYTDQPRFVNAVVGFLTQWSLIECHNALKAIESLMGKLTPKERFGPRIIDLDVLLFSQTQSSDPSILVPHPRLHERVFVLYPLTQIAPHLEVPGRGSVARLLEALPQESLAEMVDLQIPVA